jgi:hypothetical protein
VIVLVRACARAHLHPDPTWSACGWQGWDKKTLGSSHRRSRSTEAVASSEGVECVAGICIESEMLLALASQVVSKRSSSPVMDSFDSPLPCGPHIISPVGVRQ